MVYYVNDANNVHYVNHVFGLRCEQCERCLLRLLRLRRDFDQRARIDFGALGRGIGILIWT